MEELAEVRLPPGFAYEWTELALQEKLAGNTAVIAFALAVVFVFLLLAAQYESLTLPLAVILIVPMCLLAAITGVIFRGLDNNVLVPIGFVRSEERRVGKECVSTCRSRWWRYH